MQDLLLKRYDVTVFPGNYGFKTNSWFLSRLVASWYVIKGVAEVRIVDEKTGEHTVL